MFSIIGIIVVFGAVVAGYLMEQGNLWVLMQPAELLIIGGGALGIILVSSPARNLRILARAVYSVGSNRQCSRETYLDALKLLYVLFSVGRGTGRIHMESHVEAPYDSEIFQAHYSVLSDADATNFICDSLRMAISAGLNDQEVERLIAQAQAEIDAELATDVLIIEDEPVIAADIEALVRELGHNISDIVATRGEAVEAARRAAPGLVLADIQLADGSSGVDAVRDILAEHDSPVIFITAFPERLLTGERPEPTFLITKPFQPETVKAAIGQALFFHPRHRAAAA